MAAKTTGRPLADIPLNVLKALAAVGCTNKEIAASFGVSERTIEGRRRNPEFRAVIEAGIATGNISLRKKQMSLALKGNTTMLIWLGKQRLEQRDKIDTTGKIQGQRPHIHVHFRSPKKPEDAEEPKETKE